MTRLALHHLADMRRVQAYELSVLTGTQVLLLVVSETGLVYTFTTPKLQPLVTKPAGKNLIQVRRLAWTFHLLKSNIKSRSVSMQHLPPLATKKAFLNPPSSHPTTCSTRSSNNKLAACPATPRSHPTTKSRLTNSPTRITCSNSRLSSKVDSTPCRRRTECRSISSTINEDCICAASH